MRRSEFLGIAGCLAVAVTVCYGVLTAPDHVHPLGDEMINFINNVIKPNWTAGRNFNPEIDMGYINQLCGVLPGSEKFRLPEQKQLLGGLRIPKAFDSRTKWPHCPSIWEVSDQGTCGSCWALAATQVMTDRYCIAHKGKQFRFSTDNLISCCEKCGKGCKGGYATKAWEYWMETGIVSGGPWHSHHGCQPYEFPPCEHHITGPRPNCTAVKKAVTPQCTTKCESGYRVSYEKDLHHGKKSYSLSKSPTQLQIELLRNGPVEATFTVYSDFPLYKSGVYHHVLGKKTGRHSVKIIGWGLEESETPYWLVVNSWNYDWGDGGTFKILRGNDECGIESEILAGIP